MRWLKSLVVGMGILIVIGLTVVIVEVVRRADQKPSESGAVVDGPTPPVIGSLATKLQNSSDLMGDKTILIPNGAVVHEIIPDGTSLILRLNLKDGRAALLWLNKRTGEKQGWVTLDNKP